MDVSHILDSLNEDQRNAVTSEKQHLLVLAGAGSGKTRVLVHKIAWEVEALGRVHRIHKGQFPRIPEGHADRAVLVASALRVERRRVVVERLPVARVVVPVEARASRLRLEAEEVAHLFLYFLIRLGPGRVLRDEVRALVPGLPFRTWSP